MTSPVKHKQDEICSPHGITCGPHEPELRQRLNEVAGVSELFKALADETRTGVLAMLAERELCVCDLAWLMGLTPPAVSHHLRLLRALRLVRTRRAGKQVFYRLHDHHVLALIHQAREHFLEPEGEASGA